MLISVESQIIMRRSIAFHPGLAENIAPDGGPGRDIIVVRLQPLDLYSYDVTTWAPSGAIFSANPG